MSKDYYKKAKKRVEEKKKFQGHLRSYISTLAILFVIALVAAPPLRRVWPMIAIFWGIGLFSHYIKAYGFPTSKEEEEEWEDREIEKEVRRMQARDRWKNHPPHGIPTDKFDMDKHLDLELPKPVPKKKYRDEDLV